jgi:hypothetical protein
MLLCGSSGLRRKDDITVRGDTEDIFLYMENINNMDLLRH